jgi:hypothetical protein
VRKARWEERETKERNLLFLLINIIIYREIKFGVYVGPTYVYSVENALPVTMPGLCRLANVKDETKMNRQVKCRLLRQSLTTIPKYKTYSIFE